MLMCNIFNGFNPDLITKRDSKREKKEFSINFAMCVMNISGN